MCSSMKAASRDASSWVFGEYSKSMANSCADASKRKSNPASRSAPRENLLHPLPAKLGHPACPASDFRRVLACRRTIDDAAHDALRDARGAEHVVRDIEVPVVRIDRSAADAAAIRGDVFRLERDAERPEIEPPHAAEWATAGNVPTHAVIGEIGERVSQRRELPIQHGDDAGFGRMKDEIVEAIVAMNDGGLVVRRNVLRKPFDQPIHRFDFLRL